MNIITVFDLMASLCHAIISLSTEEQKSIYSSYYSNPEKAKQTIERLFPFFNRAETERLLLSFSPPNITILIEAIEKWSITPTENKYLGFLLGYLDTYIAFDEAMRLFFEITPHQDCGLIPFDCLNSNSFECQGKLLPRFQPLWTKPNIRRSSALNEDPLSVMEHFIWIETHDEWVVTNIFSPEWEYSEGNPYTIVCSPLTNHPTFNSDCFRGEDEKNYFHITEYFEDKKAPLLSKIERTMCKSSQYGTNILFFPEMLASKDVQQKCIEIVKSHWDLPLPRIICLPSSEYEEGVWKNQTIIINDSGQQLFTYNKQHAFQLDVEGGAKEFEPIKPDYKITIMHIKGLGRIGIIICADIFNESLMNLLLKKYEITLLLILAYSPGYDQFFRKISAANATMCDVIWCNTCAAYTGSGSKPVVAYFPYGHKQSDGTPYIINRCSNADNECNGCLVKISIDPSYMQKGTLESIELC